MKKAFFTKDYGERGRMIKEGWFDLLIHPKKIDRKGAAKITVSYEDVTKDAVWLELNARLSPSMRVAFECPSRYPKITSTKVQFLQRMCMKIESVTLFDVVPFTLGIEYLYTPFSYIGREILGFPHWYAFREGYSEFTDDGRVVNSLSAEALGPKIAEVSQFSYSSFTPDSVEVVNAPCTPEEKHGYMELKEVAFKKHSTPSPIVTELADYVNALDSRMQAIADAAQPGDAVFFNLASSAAKMKKLLPKGAKAYSYAKPPQEKQDRVIIAEPSIANDYQQFDAESLADRVVFVRGDMPVDAYLHGRQDAVRKQIDDLALEATK